MKKILIIDDEKKLANVLMMNFQRRGFKVLTANTGKDGVKAFKEFKPICVITDLKLPDFDGFEVIKKIKEIDFDVPIILITAYGSVEKAVNAVKLGAYDFVTKPFEFKSLFKLVNESMDMLSVVTSEKNYLDHEVAKVFPGIIGKSKKMKEIFNLIADISGSIANLFITGRSGTGKDLVARTVHYVSKRKSGPFIVINCAAVPEELLEAELFGYEKGAFTGANQVKPGLFEIANGGTIFLDEISEMSSRLQAKLLTAIQNKEIRRVGSIKNIKIDVRFISSSNRNIEKEVMEKRFREDLYYRLNVIRMDLPPLRERKEDIPMLISYFIKKFNKKNGKQIKGISNEGLLRLINYEFPGNVRELENIIEKSVVIEKTNTITERSINLNAMFETYSLENEADIIDIKCNIPLENGFSHLLTIYEETEKEIIIKTLSKFPNENNEKLAEYLGTNRRILELRMRKYGLTKKNFS